MSGKTTLVLAILISAPPGAAGEPKEETFHYLRPSGKGFADECNFTLKRDKAGWSIVGVTGRGATQMTVQARYDAEDRLLDAAATLVQGDKKARAKVTVSGGKAKVEREGQPPQVFDVARGVMVTSAPDWSDTFLLCRHFDRAGKAKQSFSGLWIHPTQPAQLLPFTIERTGKDNALELDRFTIRIRGPNPYLAWADGQGTMVKLLPLPFRAGAMNWLALRGQEKAAAGLQPPP